MANRYHVFDVKRYHVFDTAMNHLCECNTFLEIRAFAKKLSGDDRVELLIKDDVSGEWFWFVRHPELPREVQND